MESPRITVAQLGARMHYAVPRALEEAGLLHRFCTDVVTPGEHSVARLLLNRMRNVSTTARKLLARGPDRVPHSKLMALPAFGLSYAARLRATPYAGSDKDVFLWAGRRFCETLLSRNALQGATALYFYNTAGLELARHARQRGLHCIMEQTIAPMSVEMDLLGKEQEDWPNWERTYSQTDAGRLLAEREYAEWSEANVILCASEFVAEGIRSAAGPGAKTLIVPYGITFPPSANSQPARRLDGPLQVLFAGTVGLRKGIQYLDRAAALLPQRAFRIRAVGKSTLTTHGQTAVARHIELLGSVSRPEMRQIYDTSHVLVLPSLCEGSATVSYEALAAGLPVIATPNSGTVIRDGIDGFIVPARDPGAIVEKLLFLRDNPETLITMSANARNRSRDFTEEGYGDRMVTAIRDSYMSLGRSL